MLQTAANVILTVIAAQFSVMMVVIAYLLRMYAFALANVFLMNRSLGVSFGQFARRLQPIAFGIAGLALASVGVKSLLLNNHEVVRIAGVVTAGVCGYVLVICLGDKTGLWPGYIRDFWNASKTLFRKSKPADGAAT
jgi:hypothetical protein